MVTVLSRRAVIPTRTFSRTLAAFPSVQLILILVLSEVWNGEESRLILMV
jgi:hypothetical protein